jgi:F0F1-type ATP synthase membrane subunit c/vacuolar-type H+-ATPase subunit K
MCYPRTVINRLIYFAAAVTMIAPAKRTGYSDGMILTAGVLLDTYCPSSCRRGSARYKCWVIVTYSLLISILAALAVGVACLIHLLISKKII